MSLHNRIQNAIQLTKKLSIDVLVITNKSDLFYLTGIKLSAGAIFLTSTQCFLYVDSRYIQKCQEDLSFPVKLFTESPMKSFLDDQTSTNGQKIGFDSSYVNYDLFQKWEDLIRQSNTPHTLIPFSNPLEELRIIKDLQEQTLIASACSLTCQAMKFITQIIKEGITEKKLAKELEIYLLQQGADEQSFAPIVAFGKNSAMPHYTPGEVCLTKHDPILIDFGAKLHGYCSDMTRMVFLGNPHPKMKEIYEIVLEAQEATLKHLKPGISTYDVDKKARDIINQKGYENNFNHSIGHGVGLDIHESPFFSKKSDQKHTILKEGMVITVEPGIYLPQIGGVRIEDTVLITPQGCKILTKESHKQLTSLPC